MHLFVSKFNIGALLIMNAAREAKLRKLNELRRSVPYISASALAAVLEACYTEGVPDLHTRKDIYSVVKLEIGEATDYGHLIVQSELHMKDNSTKTVCFVNPFALMQKAFAQGGAQQ